MRIIVMVKQVPDTWGERTLDAETGLLARAASDRVLDEISERALEVALREKDRDKSTQVVVMTMGPPSAADVLRKALSMGADSAIHLTDDGLAGADIALTAQVLATAVSQAGFDLVISGNESTDGHGGIVPAMVAAHLHAPLLSELESIEIDGDAVTGSVLTELGTLEMSATLPAVVSVTERIAEPRFPSFKGIVSARRKPVTVLGPADLGVAEPPARSVVVAFSERPSRQSGTKIIDDGNAGTALAEYLTSSGLA